MRIFLLQLLAVTSLAARPHGGLELDDVDNFRTDGQGLMQQTEVDELAEHGPTHCQETREWTKLSETKCKAKGQRCLIKWDTANTNIGYCKSRCSASDSLAGLRPDGSSFAPWKSVANCERHGFCSFNFSKEAGFTACKEKKGCESSLTDGKLDKSNFFTCLDELGFKAFKTCGKGKGKAGSRCFEINPKATKDRCKMDDQFEVSNPIDCMAGGAKLGHKTVALTVTKNEHGQEVFQCRQENQESITDVAPFWSTCKTPVKGLVPKRIGSRVEQYTFVRYGNDEIPSCRNTWTQEEGKPKIVHLQNFKKCLRALNFKPYKPNMLLKCTEKQADVTWHDVDTSGNAADCLAFGPAAIMKLEFGKESSENKIYCTRVREDCLKREADQKDMKNQVKKQGFPTNQQLKKYYFIRDIL